MASTSNANRPFSERVFRCFLRLFPSEFREQFAGEMETVFRDQHRDAQMAGSRSHARFWWETYSGLVVTAFREHQQILFQDTDYALRMMRKELGFTLVMIVILGLGIGASTAAFTAANAILIQPLPFSGGNHLVHLQQQQPAVGVDAMPFSVKEIEDYRSAEPHPRFGGRVPRDDLQPARWPGAGAGRYRSGIGQLLPDTRCQSALWQDVHAGGR